jgi:hypothetical protein
VAQVVVPGVVAAEVAAVVGGDVAVAVGDSGCEGRGWGLCWGAVDLPGRECRHLQGAAGHFDGGGWARQWRWQP